MKSIRFNSATKLLAVFLAILMALSLFPVIAIAEDEKPADVPAADADKTNQGLAFEVTDRREETVKHFRLSDGTYAAVQYDVPVHTLDADGVWQDIDNTLSDIGSEFSTSNARVKFAKKIPGNESLFTLHDGNAKVTVSLNGATKKTTGVVTNTHTEPDENATELQKLMQLDKLSSRILYTEIMDSVDLEYVVESLNIKENIIVKERLSDYSFSFTLALNNLTAELTDAGEVCLLDPDRNVAYVIPAGYMIDADGVLSDAVTYTLTDGGNGKYTLTITADADWINDSVRAFPVTIDPTVSTLNSYVTDLYISSGSPNNNYATSGTLYVGSTWKCYWRTSSLPSIPASAYVTNVSLSMYSTSTGGNYVGVYNVTSDWDSTLTWNKTISSSPMGTTSDVLIDYNCINGTDRIDDRYYWNITSLYNSWRSGETPNYGVCFKIVSGTTANGNSVFTSANGSSAFRPCFTISYRDMKGIESYWSGSVQSAGLAGSGFVNHANGNLVFSIGTTSTTDGIFGFTPTLIYNTAIADQFNTNTYNENVPYRFTSLGYGWKLNTNESIVKGTYTGETGTDQTYYVWSDGDGTEHYFLYDSLTQTYRDEDGLSLTLTETQSHMVIEDVHGNIRQFSNSSGDNNIYAGGVLEFLKDIYGNKLRFNHNNKGQTTSVDLVPAGCDDSDAILYLTFSYNSVYTLYQIKNEVTGQVMTLEYGINFTDNSYISVTCGGPLRRIKYGHMSGNQIVTDATMYYDYTSAFGATVGNVYRLSSAKDGATGGEIRYTYDWDGKVKSVSEYADNYLGQSISFTYGNGYAEVRTSGTDDILQSGRTGDDIITHYSIDYMGHAVSAYSTNVARTAMYGATNRVYEANGSSDRTKNSIKSETVINGVATNYVYNGSFEYGSSQPLGWTLSDSQGMTLTVDGNGNAEKRLSIQTTPNTTKYVYQNVVLPSGTYTLSADCYVDGIDGATLRMAAIMVSDSSILAEQTYGMDYSASLQNSLCPVITFSVDGGRTGSAAVCVKFEVIGDDNASGNLHIDHVMLENNAGAGSYNAILFGGFENTLTQDADISLSDEWNFQYASGASVSDNGLNGKALKIEGNLNEYQSVEQIVSIVPSEAIQNGSVSTAPRTFTISGFAKGSSQMPNDEAYFCLDVEIKYYNDSRIYLLYFDFNKDLTDWQFLSASFTTKPGKIVESITVECSYAYQPGVAYFDNISLVEETGNNYAGYSYTDDGLVEFMYTPSYCQYNEYDNITRDLLVTWDSDGNGISYQYENHVLQSQISFTYDTETNDLLSWYLSDRNDNNSSEWNPTTAAKAKTQYTINSYGLNTSTVSYPADGTKDSASQKESSAQLRSFSTYDLNAGSVVFGRVLTTTDTSGQTTYYTYGSNGQLMYERYNDNSGLYYLYDSLGRMTNVYPLVYSPSLNSYYADTNCERAAYSYNNKLQLQTISTSSTDYTYTYDRYGNVETISANGSLLASYTYGNNNGKLTALTYGNGIVMEYSYDELDRISEICYNVVDGESGEPVEYKYLYTYTASGEIHSVEGTESGRKYQYTYNSRGQMTGYTELILRHNSVGDDGYTDYTQSFFWYDELDRPDYTQTTFRYSLGNAGFLSASDCYDAVGYGYTYDNSESDRDEDDVGALIEFDIFGGGINHNAAITYHYDQLYRLDTKTVEANNGSGFAQTISYAYKMVGANHTSCLVDSYQSVIGATTTQYTYTYDSVGNITRVTDNAGNITRYQYDDLGQLTREDNPYLNKTYVYTYDNAGNRTSKKTYAYTTGTLGTVISRENYEYDGDRLTRVGSMQYTYDTIGNPTYYNGYKMEWEGRQLTKMSMNGGQFGYEFEYNADGIRTMKSSLGGTAHVYGLNGSQIQTETIGNKLLVYLYDESGSPIGLQYRTTSYAANRFDTYYFEKNLQGDIIAVYTEGGTKIGSYTYDAWGVCSYSYASGATSAQKQIVSTLNPFRYRGYYYDTETGFYYLQTRYYNPQWGRFLNADGYVNANGDLIGFNMFTYCSNNPIQYIDPFGDAYLPFSLLTYPGEIHMQVLLNLKEEYGFTIENSIEGFLLRIDAIDPNSKGLAKDAYEIKPVTYRRDFMLLQAVWQLDNYIVLSNFKYKPGTREICNTFDYKNFVVTYWLEGPGIIVYTFVSKPTEVKVESHSHFPVPLLPKRDESREISANLGAAAAMVFAYAVMKMPQQKLKKECFNGW